MARVGSSEIRGIKPKFTNKENGSRMAMTVKMIPGWVLSLSTKFSIDRHFNLVAKLAILRKGILTEYDLDNYIRVFISQV
jgi:hypothetical protein